MPAWREMVLATAGTAWIGAALAASPAASQLERHTALAGEPAAASAGAGATPAPISGTPTTPVIKSAEPSPAEPKATDPKPVDIKAGESKPGESTVGTSAVVLDLAAVRGLMGRQVKTSAGEDLGHVVDLLVAPDGQIRAAVLDFGGVLGVGSRKVAVDWKALSFSQLAKDGPVQVLLTRNQVRVAPEYKVNEPIVVLEVTPEPGKTGEGKTGEGKTGEGKTGEGKTGEGKGNVEPIRAGRPQGAADTAPPSATVVAPPAKIGAPDQVKK